jgi:hypothetical protein
MATPIEKGLSSLCLTCGFSTLDNDLDDCPTCKTRLASVYTSPDKNCRECSNLLSSSAASEVYSVSDERYGNFVFNVAAMIESITRSDPDNKYAFELPRDILHQMLFVNVTEPQHYDHITSNSPGIVVDIELSDGKRMFCLVDGSHRAARAIRDNQPFLAHIVPWAKAKQFLIQLDDEDKKLIETMTF